MYNLTLVSRKIRDEYLSLYLENEFQYNYTSETALKRLLLDVSTSVPKNGKIKIVILFKQLFSTLDLLPIFKLIGAPCWEGLEVSFRCERDPATTAENMNQAIQQKSSWQGSTSQVEHITLAHYDDTDLTVQLACGPFYSRQAREEQDNAAIVWSSLGFKVKPLYILP